MSALVAEFPLIANPIVYMIVEQIVDSILSQLITGTEFGIFFEYIDLRVTQQGRDFYDAVVGHIDNPNAQSEADLIAKFNQLVLLTT